MDYNNVNYSAYLPTSSGGFTASRSCSSHHRHYRFLGYSSHHHLITTIPTMHYEVDTLFRFPKLLGTPKLNMNNREQHTTKLSLQSAYLVKLARPISKRPTQEICCDYKSHVFQDVVLAARNTFLSSNG